MVTELFSSSIYIYFFDRTPNQSVSSYRRSPKRPWRTSRRVTCPGGYFYLVTFALYVTSVQVIYFCCSISYLFTLVLISHMNKNKENWENSQGRLIQFIQSLEFLKKYVLISRPGKSMESNLIDVWEKMEKVWRIFPSWAKCLHYHWLHCWIDLLPSNASFY